ncbi:MAG: MBL fold metallo-hydrolase [Deltaproteobacteria bacterium]|nr:MAG: MBL fold metallo-hydrolase [Deltaproteobacteria bacterium]
MDLVSLEGNGQKLDGGAMFGNCPRALWSKWCPPDELGRIDLACRSLLVREDSGRTILFEAGIGAFFPPKLRERYGVTGEGHVLLDRLRALGIAPEDVDVVVLSHLHFDHAGGLLAAYAEGAAPRLVFPNAAYVVGAEALARAKAPHPRDRASFIPELPALLEATGRLECVEGERSRTLGPAYRFRVSHGHTPGMLLARIETPEGPLVFAADLIPGVPWIHVPITMGYDRYPERLIDEKRALLHDMEIEGGRLFFTHDPTVAACKVGRDDRGRFVAIDPQPSLGPA